MKSKDDFDCGGPENEFECGTCQCEETDEDKIKQMCSQENYSVMCSGRGNCRCGTCFCDKG